MIRYITGKPYYPKAPRPRRCVVCHANATHVEEAPVVRVSISRSGQVVRRPGVEGTFYCDAHTGLRA